LKKELYDAILKVYKKTEVSLVYCCFNKIRYKCVYNEKIEKKIKMILNKI